MDTPIYNLDVVTPPVTADLDEVKDHYVEYQLEQFRGLVSFLENLTGRRLDKDRLWQHIRIADEIWQLWWECDQLRKAIPSPMPSEDHFNAMVPANFMDGTVEARDFYRELYDEIKYRVDNKIGVIPNEKYRLLWAGGIPPWHTMWMFNYFEERGAVFAIERCYRTYNPVEPPSGITDPLDYMAWRSFQRLAYDRDKRVSGNLIVDELLGMVKDYNISGMVTHVSRTCRAGSVGQLYQKAMIQDYVKVPALQLISDMVDVRDYSEYQWKMQIDAFLDTVDTCRRQLNTSY
jgi:benzoyl-CoA reductase/2-hydroxyglutaryl-CoA dehydratase subunit BcrC/BadD/HgdB